jgi:hypothetical protein
MLLDECDMFHFVAYDSVWLEKNIARLFNPLVSLREELCPSAVTLMSSNQHFDYIRAKEALICRS